MYQFGWSTCNGPYIHCMTLGHWYVTCHTDRVTPLCCVVYGPHIHYTVSACCMCMYMYDVIDHCTCILQAKINIHFINTTACLCVYTVYTGGYLCLGFHTHVLARTCTCMHTYLHAHILACTHTCMHTYLHAHILACTRTCTHTYLHAHILACTRTFMHTYLHAHVLACTRTCMHGTHTFMDAYFHTHVLTSEYSP